MKKTLFFYDLETSGLSVLDQILSFAGIRVDAQTLEEVEVIDLKAQWRQDTLPSMEAYRVHQISIEDHQEAATELAVIQQIHHALNMPMTMSGGFNTLGFDDPMLRFCFHRSLMTPYTHQYQSGCSRFDILPLLPFFYLYAPHMLQWPKHPDGRTSFKLEDLNQANNWLKGVAHEALFDVKVTLALARTLRVNQPMWQYLMGYFDKTIDRQRSQIESLGIMVDLRFGHAVSYQAPVIYLGPHHQYKNSLVYLRLDQLIDFDNIDDLSARVVRKKIAEPGFILPFVDKYASKMPELARAAAQENLNRMKAVDIDQIKQSLRHQDMTQEQEFVDLDAALYQEGFMSEAEQRWCQHFLLGGEHARKELLGSMNNRSLYKRALRLLWRHFPEQLTPELKTAATMTINDYVYHGIDQKGRIRANLDQVIQSLSNTSDEEAKKILRHLVRLKESLVTLSQSP